MRNGEEITACGKRCQFVKLYPASRLQETLGGNKTSLLLILIEGKVNTAPCN
jgi:hypothetical protein